MTDLDLDFERVVLLARDHEEVRWLAGRLAGRGQLTLLVLEQRTRADRVALWRRRARRNGLKRTASAGAALVVDRLVTAMLERRLKVTCEESELPPARQVPDVNSREIQQLVADVRPTLGLVLGTRILGAEVIAAFGTAPLLNLHSGMTPTYRGTHGGAWALLDGRPDRVASTWHVVDLGIDTGRPVAHVPVAPQPTLALLAREHRRAGVHYLDGLAAQGNAAVRPPDLAPRGELLYPPGLNDWRRFRHLVAAPGRQR